MYSKHSRTSVMEFFTELFNGLLATGSFHKMLHYRCLPGSNYASNYEITKGGRIRWNFSFTTLKFLFQKKNVEIFQEAKCVSWNIIQFVHTITFYSYNHDNVSFIERINNFHFSCQRYYSFKCLKILKKRSQLCC